MRLLILAAAAWCAAALCAADDTQRESKSDGRLIQGKWKVVSAEEEGAEQQFSGDVSVTITDDKLSINPKQGEPIVLEYSLDPTQDPKAIDTGHAIDADRPILQRGIYSLKGDDLKLCIAGKGQRRPTKFDSDEGVLLTLKRER